ncbi:LysR substrate-binding domain-containing protein [Roseovarius arcticus]|uniref:LysR substrate-binding domain-containing protein n=1 Tax=Roseovarius arcticus TaxID=2547404 RepID=UPI001110A8EE|nr:LysR family transcriptional regulator [Roseovarius arcticus]
MKPGSFRYLPFLRCFEAVARCGSLRTASRELGLSPGAVSLQLKKLSNASGLDLFMRDGRRLVLTADGQAFYGVVRRSLVDLELGIFGDKRESEPPSRLALSVPPSLGTAWLCSALIDFCRAHSIANVKISSDTRASTLDWTDLDMAIVYDHPPFENLWWSLLREVNLRTVCAPCALPTMDGQDDRRSLRGHTLLHEDDGQEWLRWSQTAGVSLDGVSNVFLPSIGQAVTSALNGQGLALVSDALVGGDLRSGRLVQPFNMSIPGSRAYYFVSQPSKINNWFHEKIRAEVLRMLPPDMG